jgi:hypothetical protein
VAPPLNLRFFDINSIDLSKKILACDFSRTVRELNAMKSWKISLLNNIAVNYIIAESCYLCQ